MITEPRSTERLIQLLNSVNDTVVTKHIGDLCREAACRLAQLTVQQVQDAERSERTAMQTRKLSRLQSAANALYFAAWWRTDRTCDNRALWTELRDALGIEPGSASFFLGPERRPIETASFGEYILTDGARRVLLERHRQVHDEGWSAEHDDKHTDSSIARAAAAYAFIGAFVEPLVLNDRIAGNLLWPATWSKHWFKPKDQLRDLERAGALIIAEIDRLLRLQARGIENTGQIIGNHADRIVIDDPGHDGDTSATRLALQDFIVDLKRPKPADEDYAKALPFDGMPDAA